MQVMLIAAVIYVLMSVITLVVMWGDKRAAERHGWRTPETTLHLLELLGGWPGTLISQRLLRHKGRKLRYRIVLWCIIALHLAVWAGCVWWKYAGGFDG